MKYAQLTESKKSDYEIYHNSYTDAVTEVMAFIKKNGYTVTDDDVHSEITIGIGRPKVGKTNKFMLPLYKGDKKQKKAMHFQVYGMEKKYELNMYIS